MFTVRSLRLAIASLGISIVVSNLAIARDLALTVPAETLIFVQRAGGDETRESLDATAFGRLLNEPEVQKFLEQTWTLAESLILPALVDEKSNQIYSDVKTLLGFLARRPTALALLDFTKKGEDVQPHAALIVYAGDDESRLKSAFEALLKGCGAPRSKKAKGMPKSVRFVCNSEAGAVYYATHKGHLIVTIGKSTLKKVLDCLKDDSDSLARAPGLTGARKIIGGSDESRAWTFHIQSEKCFDALRRQLEGEDAQSVEEISRVLAIVESVVMGHAATITWERHYRDEGCWSTTYHAPRDGKRVTSTLRTDQVVSEDDLNLIPRSPTWAFVTKIDLAGSWKSLRASLRGLDEKVDASLSEALGIAAEAIGYDVESELLPLIGETVIAYETPTDGMFPMMGTIILVESPDPSALSDRLKDAIEAINQRFGGGRLSVSEGRTKGGSTRSLNFVGSPVPIAPTWGVADRWLVVGLSPNSVGPVVASLVNGKVDKGKSLVTNTAFQQLREKIGPLGSSFNYSDVKAGMNGLYPAAHFGLQFLAANVKGAPIPELPSLDALTKHLFAEVSTTRREGEGEISITYGPLPISGSIVSPTSISTMAMATAILLPSLSRARELSKRTVCAANLRGIGQAMYIYAIDHDNRFPKDFKELLSDGNVIEGNFNCPSSTCENGELDCCYEYIAGQSSTDDVRNVLVYDKEGIHGPESGGNVLFVDAHVEFVKPYSRIQELVEETRLRLAKKEDAKPDKKKTNKKKPTKKKGKKAPRD